MARTPKLTPLEAFEANVADAEALIRYARALKNKRSRRMRHELREQIGKALKVPSSQREQLDCLESDDLFVVFKPYGDLGTDHFTDLQPLLRQSLVAACAALETYVADKVMDFVGPALKKDPIPVRMRNISLTVGHWADIEKTYSRRGWGLRSIIEKYIREESSAAPSKIGVLLSTIDVKGWSKEVDRVRKVPTQTTVSQLDEIAKRRNLIAHTADRQGQSKSRTKISPEEVEEQLATIRDVVTALEKVLDAHVL